MLITKIAQHQNNFLRYTSFENSARECWYGILKCHLEINPNLVVLLPAYIGFSVNEGSGIFDPIINSGCRFDFYSVNDKLQINIHDFKDKVTKNQKDVLVLLVHYFGFPDVNYPELCIWLEEKSILFIEDCAHALLTDLVGGMCGRAGEASFYSLHKLLPLSKGGMLKLNKPNLKIENLVEQNIAINYWEYDLYQIYQKRRLNYNYLVEMLSNVKNLEILYPNLIDGIGPQTLPVFVSNNRDNLYQKMNHHGFGLVSLYHTMINEIDPIIFPESHLLAKKIFNFPVHQDIDHEAILKMYKYFIQIYDY